jgi:hypothetical protein
MSGKPRLLVDEALVLIDALIAEAERRQNEGTLGQPVHAISKSDQEVILTIFTPKIMGDYDDLSPVGAIILSATDRLRAKLSAEHSESGCITVESESKDCRVNLLGVGVDNPIVQLKELRDILNKDIREELADPQVWSKQSASSPKGIERSFSQKVVDPDQYSIDVQVMKFEDPGGEKDLRSYLLRSIIDENLSKGEQPQFKLALHHGSRFIRDMEYPPEFLEDIDYSEDDKRLKYRLTVPELVAELLLRDRFGVDLKKVREACITR